jgi:indole-3-glycerol phosphate synthase
MILDKILQQKIKEVQQLKQYFDSKDQKKIISNLKNHKNKDFYQSLKKKKPYSIIAECKKASPSKGLIRSNYNPIEIAKLYESLGASAISVLTDQYFFLGSIEDLYNVSKNVNIPVLRKDFIISKEQIIEAKLNGADAILLIIRILKEDQLKELLDFSYELNLDCLIEVHNEKEIELALKYPIKVIGINHRDLDTLEMNRELSIKYAPQIRLSHPDLIIVAESGIEEPEIIKELSNYVDAFLIGTYFMQSENIQKAWQKLFSDFYINS